MLHAQSLFIVYSLIVPVIKLSAGFVSERQPGHMTFELLPMLFRAGDTQQHKDVIVV